MHHSKNNPVPNSLQFTGIKQENWLHPGLDLTKNDLALKTLQHCEKDSDIEFLITTAHIQQRSESL